MIDDVLNELRQAIEKSKDALRRETAKLRTGRAHPSMLDSIRVDYYGQTTPLGQMATVSVPEPRLLTVKPWDKSQVKAAEKALRESDLGLNPQVALRAKKKPGRSRVSIMRGIGGLVPRLWEPCYAGCTAPTPKPMSKEYRTFMTDSIPLSRGVGSAA